MTPSLALQACLATPWQATPDLPLRALITAALLVLAAWAARKRPFAGQLPFVSLALVMAAWIGASVVEHAAVDAACKGTVGLLAWPVVLAQPLLTGLFVHCFLGTGGLTGPVRPRRLLLLALPSLVLGALALSNGAHGWFYGPQTQLSGPIAGLPRLVYGYGPAFYAALAVGYASLLAALGLAVQTGWLAAAVPRRTRQQARGLVLAMAVPLLTNLAYVAGGVRVLGVDPTSMAFAVSIAAVAWLVHREQLFSVVPMAHRLLFAQLPDPVLVLDATGCVVEANPAALALAAATAPAAALGQPLLNWPRVGPPLVAHLQLLQAQALQAQRIQAQASGAHALQTAQTQHTMPTESPTVLELPHPPAWFEVQQHRLVSNRETVGLLVQLHDVSSRHRAHARVVRELAERDVELGKATALQALLREQAMHDPLTGLLNRRALTEHHANQSNDTSAAHVLVLMDLDHFKRVNDEHGHPAGDAVLRDFAAALRSGLRANDALFRIGGEEFVLLMPAVTPDFAAQRVRALREIVARWHLGALPGAVTFSAGVAAGNPATTALEVTLAAADAALYRAKREGRNRTVVAELGAGPVAVASQQPNVDKSVTIFAADQTAEALH
jgi:diguanylate cyclase (GGDEF)-like protein